MKFILEQLQQLQRKNFKLQTLKGFIISRLLSHFETGEVNSQMFMNIYGRFPQVFATFATCVIDSGFEEPEKTNICYFSIQERDEMALHFHLCIVC